MSERFPEPERIEDDRSIQYRWHTGQMIDDHGRPGEVMVVLEVSHSRHYKRYEAELYTIERYPNGYRRAFAIADPVLTTTNSSAVLFREPAARFGKGQLLKYAADALERVMTGELDDNGHAFRFLIKRDPASYIEKPDDDVLAVSADGYRAAMYRDPNSGDMRFAITVPTDHVDDIAIDLNDERIYPA